ncbi:hypothetical protein E3P99_00250 [Wallemia hederae]|uniref:MADS-box domain-containing protein n=1 Tax=Wallemia hederae TaxID=1540922 RepID=A0A4T0FW79_9BASI|nr:hypothetical protein E3P99_00250 [Wallemia hederae]
MGRRKISIRPLKDDRNRKVTFSKRCNGMFKKAYELSVLCSVDIAIIAFDSDGKLHEFSSGNIEKILMKYTEHNGDSNVKGPRDYCDDHDSDDGEGGGGGGGGSAIHDSRDADTAEPETDHHQHHHTHAMTQSQSPRASSSVKQEGAIERDEREVKPRIEVDSAVDEGIATGYANASTPAHHPHSPAHAPPPRSPKHTLSPYNMATSFLSPNAGSGVAQSDQLLNWQYAQMHAAHMMQQQQQVASQVRSNQHSSNSSNNSNSNTQSSQFLSPTAPYTNTHTAQPPPPPPFFSPGIPNIPIGGLPWYASIPPLAWPPPNASANVNAQTQQQQQQQLPQALLMDPFQFPLDGLPTAEPFQWPVPKEDSGGMGVSTQAAQPQQQQQQQQTPLAANANANSNSTTNSNSDTNTPSHSHSVSAGSDHNAHTHAHSSPSHHPHQHHHHSPRQKRARKS